MIKVSFPGGLGVELIWSSCSLTSPHPVTAGMQQEQDFTRNVASTSNNLINRDLAGGHPRIATRRRGYCWPEGRSPSSREPQLVVPCAQPAGSPLGGEGWSSSCISRASVVACGLVTTISTRDFAEQHAQAAERPRSSCMTRPIGHALAAALVENSPPQSPTTMCLAGGRMSMREHGPQRAPSDFLFSAADGPWQVESTMAGAFRWSGMMRLSLFGLSLRREMAPIPIAQAQPVRQTKTWCCCFPPIPTRRKRRRLRPSNLLAQLCVRLPHRHSLLAQPCSAER